MTRENMARLLLLAVLCSVLIYITGCTVESLDEKKLTMAETWAECLKTREGEARYNLMSEEMKTSFIEEQKKRSDNQEDWNFNIGWSSPDIIDYEITLDGDKVLILYHLQDSIPKYYEMTEILTFAEEAGELVITHSKSPLQEWELFSYHAFTAEDALEYYRQALLESSYIKILAITPTANFFPDGEEIWETVRIDDVKIINSDVRENKACYELELDIADSGHSTFDAGISPRWLWLARDEKGWYAEGLMTGGEPDEAWWTDADTQE